MTKPLSISQTSRARRLIGLLQSRPRPLQHVVTQRPAVISTSLQPDFEAVVVPVNGSKSDFNYVATFPALPPGTAGLLDIQLNVQAYASFSVANTLPRLVLVSCADASTYGPGQSYVRLPRVTTAATVVSAQSMSFLVPVPADATSVTIKLSARAVENLSSVLSSLTLTISALRAVISPIA